MKTRRPRGNRRPGSKWQVQRERCRLDRQGPEPEDRGADMAHLVAGVMKRLGLADEHWLAEMADEWTGLVGDAVAAHARPGRVERGTLYVFVDSSVWLSELQRYGSTQLLQNLGQRFGRERVKAVRFVMDPEGPGGAR